MVNAERDGKVAPHPALHAYPIRTKQRTPFLAPCAQHLCRITRSAPDDPISTRGSRPLACEIRQLSPFLAYSRILPANFALCELCASILSSPKFRPPAVQETSLARWNPHVSKHRCSSVLLSTWRAGISRVGSFHSLHLRAYPYNNSPSNPGAPSPCTRTKQPNAFLELL